MTERPRAARHTVVRPTDVRGTVEEVKKILEDLTGRLGPITAERHVPVNHHGHEGLRERVTGG